MRTIDRYVYHAPWEPNPHPYASGGENIVGLGYVMENPIVRWQPGERFLGPPIRPVCPAWGCDGPPIMRYPPYWGPGSTNVVPQPPPNMGPVGAPVVPTYGGPGISPAPAPTVAVSPTQTGPQLTQPGTTLDASGASVTTASGIGAWFGESTLISGVPNWGIAAAGLAALMLFMGKGGRR